MSGRPPPRPKDRQTPMKLLPRPKLRLHAVMRNTLFVLAEALKSYIVCCHFSTDIDQIVVGNNRCPCGLDFSSIMPDKIDLLQCQLTNAADASTTCQGAVQTEQLRCNGAQAQELPCNGAAARLEGLRCNGAQAEAYKCNGLQGFPEELPRESNVSPE